MRLRAAIDTGKVEEKIADIRKDNLCAFGQWLYGEAIPSNVRNSPDYEKVRGLHAQFHQCAAKVLEAVQNNRKPEANAMMGMSGDYTRVSADLTSAMMKWQQSAKD